MVFEFKLPDIGEGVHEGEIVAWKVKEGDAVQENQPIVEVMTDKATVEITSPRTGVIAKVPVKEGQVVKVGEVILVIDDSGGAKAPPAPAKAAAPEKAKDEEKTLFDLPSDLSASSRRRPAAAKPSIAPAAPAASAATVAVRASGERALATPATRHRAREMGLDIQRVPGTGPNGRVTKEDLERFATVSGPSAAGTVAVTVSAPPVATAAADTRLPLKGMRKAIFESMQRSEAYAVPFTYWDACDVTDLVKLRKDAQKIAEEQGVKLSYLPFIVKAVVAGLKRYPDVNAVVDEASHELVRKAAYNVGIAVATERGLMVVVVKDADRKSVFQIGKEIEDLAEKARAGKASMDDLKGSTFTITSLGKDGGLGATPVINHPEVAILGVHKIEKRAAVAPDGETIVARDFMNLSGSFDHRYIDGHVAAAFVQHVITLLAKPNLLLLGTV